MTNFTEVHDGYRVTKSQKKAIEKLEKEYGGIVEADVRIIFAEDDEIQVSIEYLGDVLETGAFISNRGKIALI